MFKKTRQVIQMVYKLREGTYLCTKWFESGSKGLKKYLKC